MYLKNKFPRKRDYKTKEGVFVGLQIRELIQDVKFEDPLKLNGKSIMEILKKMALPVFWGNHKAENYRDMVADLVQSYKATGCSMSLKAHFLECHLDFFPENLSTVSDEHRQRFHQDISTIERRYQGKRSPSMLADYCWTLKTAVPKAKSPTVTLYVM